MISNKRFLRLPDTQNEVTCSLQFSQKTSSILICYLFVVKMEAQHLYSRVIIILPCPSLWIVASSFNILTYANCLDFYTDESSTIKKNIRFIVNAISTTIINLYCTPIWLLFVESWVKKFILLLYMAVWVCFFIYRTTESK